MVYKDKKYQLQAQRNHYLNNKEDYLNRNKIRRNERKIWFSEIMKDKCCCKCSESAIECLDWHHIDPNEKDSNVSALLNNFRSKERILKEIEKCVLLCSNCHRKVHSGTLIL